MMKGDSWTKVSCKGCENWFPWNVVLGFPPSFCANCEDIELKNWEYRRDPFDFLDEEFPEILNECNH